MSRRIYIASTGAGAGAQDQIWRRPGCSEYFAGATFPYGREQLVDFLGFEPTQFCSEDTAIHMAMMAYYHAWQPGAEAVGVGVSAAVASKSPRRGANRIHAAIMTSEGVRRVSRELGPGHGAEARETQGCAADLLMLDMIEGERDGTVCTQQATDLFLSKAFWSATGQRLAAPPTKQTLYPGAFNPPHEGHFALAAQERAAFWIEACAPNKPALALADMVKRAKLLRGQDRLFTSGCPLYLDKSNAFPERSFVIGADAFLRMLDVNWGPDPLDLLRTLAANGTTLLVAGRLVGEQFISGDAAIATVPESMIYNLRPITGRWDLSSSELRNSASSGR